MRRLVWIISVVVIGMAIFFFYQQRSQAPVIDQQQVFEVVMAEKMRDLYQQAQDWSTPVQIEIQDKRLSGNYKIMSEFLLGYWIENVEARNHYLRELKAANWDTFLDIERLQRDRQQAYKDTEQMLNSVQKSSAYYEKQRQQIQRTYLEQVKTLSIDHDMKQSLQTKLQNNLKADKAHDIFPIEQQIIKKAQAMFAMLKKYPWQSKDKMILFPETTQVKKFNTLYQEVLTLNKKIEQIKQSNVAVLEQEL